MQPNEAQDTVSCLCHKAKQLWLMFYLDPKVLSSWMAPSPHWCMGLLLLRSRIFYFSLNCMSAHFSSLSSFWMVAHDSVIISHSSKFCVICKLAAGALCPIIQIIHEYVKQDASEILQCSREVLS